MYTSFYAWSEDYFYSSVIITHAHMHISEFASLTQQ